MCFVVLPAAKVWQSCSLESGEDVVLSSELTVKVEGVGDMNCSHRNMKSRPVAQALTEASEP